MTCQCCLFKTTLENLEQCFDDMSSDNLSCEEQDAREKLIELCTQIYYAYGFEEE